MNKHYQDRCKILFLHVGAELYGSDRVLLNVIESIDISEWEPIVFLPEMGPLYDKLSQMGVEVNISRYPILRRGQSSFTGFIFYVLEFIFSVTYLCFYIKKRNINLVYSNTIAVIPGLVASYICQSSSIWHIHEIITEPMWFMPLMRKIAKITRPYMIYVSQAVKNEFEGFSVNYLNSAVVYNSVPDQVGNVNRRLNNEKITIGMVGRVNHWKGQDVFLEMASVLLKKYLNLKFIMVGGVFKNQEYLFDKLLKKASELPGEVIVQGFSSDVNQIMDKFDIMIVPSKLPEPFGLVALEGMLHGIPIIASRNGGLVEIVEDSVTGFLVDPGDANAFADKVDLLLLDRQRMIEMGRLGRQRATTMFSNKRFANEIVQLLTMIITSKH